VTQEAITLGALSNAAQPDSSLRSYTNAVTQKLALFVFYLALSHGRNLSVVGSTGCFELGGKKLLPL
jgi:hypothetical protein